MTHSFRIPSKCRCTLEAPILPLSLGICQPPVITKCKDKTTEGPNFHSI